MVLMLESDNATLEVRYPGAFDVVVCPVCGEQSWTLFPTEGAFCDECNLKLTLGPTNGDPGFIARFDADHCHPSHFDSAPPESHLIPEDPDHGRSATAKFMHSDDQYGMYWFDTSANQRAAYNDDFDLSEVEESWRPAWEREGATTSQQQWSPFFGNVSSDDERATSATSGTEVVVVDSDDSE